MIKVGFIGTGLIAGSHARRLAVTPQAEIVACFDSDHERAVVFARSHGGKPLGDAAEVIEMSDAVYVCTWTSAHPELVAQVVAAGKAIFCEKPLGVDLATASSMAEAVARAGVANQVGLVLRHSPAFRWLHHQARDPQHGPIMSLVFRDDQYLPIQGLYGSTWRAEMELAGSGVLLEHSIHDLDLITWLLGPIEWVSCQTAFHHQISGIEDQATVTLKARSGAHAVLVSVWHDVLSRPSQRRVELFRTGGVFGLEGDWTDPVTSELVSQGRTSLGGEELTELARRFDGRSSNPDRAFVEALSSDQPAYPGFEDALEAHRLVDAAYRSARAGGAAILLT